MARIYHNVTGSTGTDVELIAAGTNVGQIESIAITNTSTSVEASAGLKLYKDSDLLIHEAYLYDIKKAGHGQIKGSIRMAERNNIKILALTHINRDLKKKGFKIPKTKVEVIIPKPFNEFRP